MLHGRGGTDRLVRDRLHPDDLASPQESVGDDQRADVRIPQSRRDGVRAVAGEQRQHDPTDLDDREERDDQFGAHRHEQRDAVALLNAEGAEAGGALVDVLPQLPVRLEARRSFFAFPPDGHSLFDWRADPLVEAVVDDVHPPADTPARPRDTARGVEDLGIGLVELDGEIVEDGAPEPLWIGGRSGEQLGVVAESVAVDEIRETAVGDVFSARAPGDLAARH